MLILAGVSISAIVGEDGILTKAMMASNQQKIAADLESLNMELTGLNTDLIVGNKDNFTTDEIVGYLVNANVLDDAKRSESGNILGGIDMATGEKFFFGLKGENTYKINIGKDGILTASNSTTASGGEVTGGTVIVSNKDFNTDSENEEDKGKFTITSDSEVLFMDTISGDLSIYVQSGVHAKVGIYADMTLTNQNLARSAIDIEPGGILDLYISDGINVVVNSGLGGSPAPIGTMYNKTDGVVGGNGGFAGIHVPYYTEDTIIKYSTTDEITGDVTWKNVSYQAGYATLNLKGNGTIKCYGGDAGKGGDGADNNIDYGGGGGGGAGAGIGGNGGRGGAGRGVIGEQGNIGENCGMVNIYNSIRVEAYGGRGASGGANTNTGARIQNGGGGGGCPAAGIGGGGAGGTSGNSQDPGAGFGVGNGEYTFFDGAHNGLTLQNKQHDNVAVAGSYYESYANKSFASTTQKMLYDYIIEDNGQLSSPEKSYSGGIGGGCTIAHMGKSGFIPDLNSGGKGGNIKVSSNAQIYAYNGSYITTDDLLERTDIERKNTQALIYAQAGYNIKAIRELVKVKVVNARTIEDLNVEWNDSNVWNISFRNYKTILSPFKSDVAKINNVNILKNEYFLGIGSGAGGSQSSDGNGSYIVDSSMN